MYSPLFTKILHIVTYNIENINCLNVVFALRVSLFAVSLDILSFHPYKNKEV